MTDVKQITKSKIICTLGPASDSPEMIERLSGLGMDCSRKNFSHDTDEYKKNLFEQIRKAVPGLAILCGIQGPKIRIWRVREGGAVLRSGDEITVTSEDVVDDENRISVMYDRLRELEMEDYGDFKGKSIRA